MRHCGGSLQHSTMTLAPLTICHGRPLPRRLIDRAKLHGAQLSTLVLCVITPAGAGYGTPEGNGYSGSQQYGAQQPAASPYGNAAQAQPYTPAQQPVSPPGTTIMLLGLSTAP